MKQLLLVRHGPTRATQNGAFGADEPLLDGVAARAAELGHRLPPGATVVCSPALRCRQTAEALGLAAAIDPRLTECDFGSWEGRTFAEIESSHRELTAGWLADPDAAPHGGESLRTFATRVGRWLAGIADSGAETVVAVTHAGVVKALVVQALSAPLRAFWQVDVAPLSITELRAHDADWSLHRLNWTDR